MGCAESKGGSNSVAETKVAEYVAAFDANQKIKVSGNICGRLARGKKEAEFEKLSFATGRKFAWCVGPDGLEDWLGRAHDKIICSIGKDEGWLKERLAGGTSWRIFVWNGDGTRELGDWDGLFKLIAREYGAELHEKLSKWRNDLESKKFADMIAADWPGGEDAKNERTAAKQAGHKHHMDVKRYLALPDAEDSLQNARLLLWHDFGLNEFYSGDGKTADGGLEYIVPNVDNVRDLRDLKVLNLKPFE